MKKLIITAVLALVGLLASPAISAQGKLVTLNMKNQPLSEFIKSVEKQTDCKFFYESSTIDRNTPVTVSVKNATLDKTLSAALSHTGIKYTVNGNRVILSAAAKKPSVPVKLKGKVIDENGEPIIGAGILEEGSTNGSVTDIDGNFALNTNSDAVLVVSSLGYLTKKVNVGLASDISVVLKEDLMGLEESVVIGYGSEKRLNLTGSVASVSSKVLEDRPLTDLLSGLQGVIGNLNITQESGAIGAEAKFNIRGESNFSSTGPLILIDGVEGDPNMVNPADVKDVVVLKDAASSAIYGAKAAYGVMLITTKNGTVTKKPVIQFNANCSINTPTSWTKNVSALEWHQMLQDGAYNNNGGAYYNDEEWAMIQKRYVTDPENTPDYYHASSDPEGVYRYLADTKWMDVLNKKVTISQQYNVNVSGGSNGFKYYSSVGYYTREGYEKFYPDVYTRITNNNKLTFDVNNWLQVGVNTNMTLVHKDVSLRYDSSWDVNVPNYYPVYNPGGDWAGYDRWTIDNPAQAAAEGGNTDTRNNQYIVTGLVKITPFKGFQIDADYSYKFIDQRVKTVTNQYYWYDMNGNLAKVLSDDSGRSSVKHNSRQNRNYVLNIYGTYQTSFAQKHNLKAMVGFSQEHLNVNMFTSKRFDLVSQDVPYLSQATGDMAVSDDEQELALRGLFFRLNYNYKEKYLVEVNGRYDGSSRFPKEDRFKMFPSASAAWRISGENFWAPLEKAVSDLKFRASYGSLGNQVLGDYYPFYTDYSASTVIVNGERVKTFKPGGLVSDTLTWETVNTLDFGIDAAFLNNRLTATFDWYCRKTIGALTKSKTLPAYIAVTEPIANASDLKTKGWELQLGWRDSFDNGLRYSIVANLSDSKTVVTDYDNPNKVFSDYYIGQTVGDIWGFRTVGIFQSDEEAAAAPDQKALIGKEMKAGDLQYEDVDGDGVISFGSKTLEDHGDMVILGNTRPRYSYSVNCSLEYKGWDFNLMLQGVGKRSVVNNHEYVIYGSTWTIPWDVSKDYWTPDNTDAHLPRIHPDMNYADFGAFDRIVWNISYLRVKNFAVGYTIPPRLTKRAGIANLRVYFSGDNLFTFKKCIKYFDPEMASQNSIPFMRSCSFGINLTL
ncbi:MAG: TonB-dependent receptor [Candidatus Cryptobacteroides sp.]